MMSLNVLPLFEEWNPPVLKARKREYEQLKEAIEFQKPSNFWINGDRGLGKTLTVKDFFVPLVNNYIDGSKAFYLGVTKTKVSDIVKEFSRRTVGKKIGDMIDILEEIVKKYDNTAKFCFIFDDLQHITHIKRDFSNVLFQIYEFFKNLGVEKNCQLILISQLPYSERYKYLDGDVTSRFQFKPLTFSQYSKSELAELYKQRIKFLNIMSNDDVCYLIADEVSQLGGDFRFGLNILRESIEKYGNLYEKSVIESIHDCKVRWVEEIILEKLNPHSALLLYLLSLMSEGKHYKWGVKDIREMTNNGESPLILFDDLRREYEKQMKKLKIKPMSRMSVWRAVEELDENDLVKKKSLNGEHPFNYIKKRGLFVKMNVEESIISNLNIDWKELFK